MNADLDALATALYVVIDDTLTEHPEWCPQRPAVGLTPKLSDSELLTLAAIQALLGYTSEARFIRHAQTHLHQAFPYLPNRPGYNKRLRRAGHLMQHVIAHLAEPARPTTTTCGWRTQPQWNVAAAAKQPNDQTWPAGPPTGTAPHTSGSSGDYDCISSPHPPACPSHSPSPPAKHDERDTALQMIEMNPEAFVIRVELLRALDVLVASGYQLRAAGDDGTIGLGATGSRL